MHLINPEVYHALKGLVQFSKVVKKHLASEL
jgi:hypothetical protein